MGFALRAWLASVLALYVAFYLQLQMPYWAWLTVWIVAQPTPGMLLSKSLYLVLGTIVGAFMGILLIALFSQTPELFVLALATVIGGFTVASNILTNFRAYGTVLGAYTSGIIASDSINSPDQVFFIAMARGSCILTGIACSILVTVAFASFRAEGETRKLLLEAFKAAAQRAAFSWQGSEDERIKIGRKLVTDLIALESQIEFAAAESGVFRLQANHARSMVSHLFSLVSARRSLDAHLRRRGWPSEDELDLFHEAILKFLRGMPERLDRGELEELQNEIVEMRRRLARLQPEEVTGPFDEVVSERLVIDRMDDLLKHLGGALEDWHDVVREKIDRKPQMTLNFHRDLRAAWINGLRGFVAVVATGAFWIASAWDHGPGALVFVAVLMSLFSSFPHPERIGWTFIKAGSVALVLAVICKYYLLPSNSGFEYLALVLALFLIPLGLVMSNPTTTIAAGGFSFVFVSLVGPTNPMVYDLSDTLNSGLATLVGILFGTLAYILVLPPDPVAARQYVTYRIRRGLEWLALVQPLPATSCRWETRMYDRVLRLNDPQNPSGTPTNEWYSAGLAALTLGNEILRLRRWLERENLSAEVRAGVEKVVGSFGRFLPDPQNAGEEVKKQIQRMAGLDPGQGQAQRLVCARVVGALQEIDNYLKLGPALLKPGAENEFEGFYV